MIRAEIGSRFAGQPSQTVDQLLATLDAYALDPSFEEYGNFIIADPRRYTDGGRIHPDAPGAVRFFGNFARLSCGFSVDTDEPETIERLTAAIRANQQRPDYRADRIRRELARDELDRIRRDARDELRPTGRVHRMGAGYIDIPEVGPGGRPETSS